MSHTIILLTDRETLYSIEDNSGLEDALESLSDGIQEQTAMEGRFILRREQDGICLKLVSNHSSLLIDSRIQRALNFIHTYYEDNIPLKQIARSAYMSPCHFCRIFRKEMGMSCLQYLNRFRITKAKQLLDETDLSITRICFDTGFNSLTHFYRVFKQIDGRSPSGYRKAINKKKAEFVK